MMIGSKLTFRAIQTDRLKVELRFNVITGLLTTLKQECKKMITVSKFIQYQLANDDFGNLIVLSPGNYESIYYYVYGKTIQE
jgi:hypothetical protein